MGKISVGSVVARAEMAPVLTEYFCFRFYSSPEKNQQESY
jgi:hypothetical protein